MAESPSKAAGYSLTLALEATELNMNGARETQPSRRARTQDANPSDDPSTKERDEWKARTMIEGDSKAPPASTASSTCLKAGARGKHTRSVVMTGEHNRGREESRTGKENRPEEQTSPSDSDSNAHHRYCGGRATP